MKMRFSKLLTGMALCLLANFAQARNAGSYYGHYYATSGQDNTSTSISTLCSKKAITGINYRINWGDYETGDNTYTNVTAIDQVLNTIATLPGPTGTFGSSNYVAGSDCKVWIFVTIKDFSPGNPCPTWLKDKDGNPGIAPTNASTAIVNIASGATAVTNASPIVITTSTPHNFSTGDRIFIDNVAGNTAANGFWTINVTSTTKFSLTGSHGNGARVQSGSPTGWYGRATTGGAFICKLWDPTVLAKYNAMLTHLGAQYDGKQNIIGFQQEESAVSTNGSYDDTPASGGDYVGTTYASSLASIMTQCGTAFPTSNCMDFLNQIQGNASGLGTVAAALAAIPNHRGCYSGPDILPDDANLVAGTYQYLNAYGGSNGCRSNSAQNTTILSACAATNCNAIFLFAVQGTLGTLSKTVPLPAGQGLCINAFIFWNDSVAEQAKADVTVQKYPFNSAWNSHCSGGGPP
jgi:hypothetical protein